MVGWTNPYDSSDSMAVVRLCGLQPPQGHPFMKKTNRDLGRILIAEDVESVASLMETWLVKQGYLVEVAMDGEQCLEKVATFKPALILLDLMLPKIHGMEVLRTLRENPATKGIGVIVCTAKHYKSDEDHSYELGAFDFLPKPFEIPEFLSAVERFFKGGAKAIHHHDIITETKETFVATIPKELSYFRAWGTRGSTPVSGHRYARYGGNTSCLEVGDDETSVIVDAGSGIRDLGLKLLKEGPRTIHLLITHTHWDHIQGFPFFAPAYVPGFEIVIHGAASFNKDLKSVFSGQLDRDYFPVQFQDMRASIDFVPLEEVLELGAFKITWEYTHHPAATVGYKFERDGRKLAYVSDNEFLYGYLGAPHDLALDSEVVLHHRRLAEWVKGVDVLIGEAQYMNEEYRNKIGWGHSSLSNACVLAKLAEVNRWFVTHHDPLHDDEFLDHKLNVTKELLQTLGQRIDVANAHDGLVGYW